MVHHKWMVKMKRMLAGFLTAGLILTGMPSLSVNAANEVLEETLPGKSDTETEKPEDEQEKPVVGEDQPSDEQPDGEENKSEEETSAGGEIQPDEEQPGVGEVKEPPVSEEDTPPAEETVDTSVSENDLYTVSENHLGTVSENNLTFNNEEEWPIIVGGYHELPEERNVSVVDENARIYDYDSEIAPLMTDSLPTQYIPDKGTLPLTRDQNPYGSCWAHSAMALAEIDMMHNEGVSGSDADYSELHLAYFSYNGAVNDPLGGLDGDSNTGVYDSKAPNFLQRGGNLSMVANVLTSWVGAADEDTAPYSQASAVLDSGLSKDIAFTDAAHLQNAFEVNLRENKDVAKRMILKYGGLGTSYCHASQFYDYDYNSFYCDTQYSVNHAVTIVGWDDTFPADHFKIRPDGNGAWLIRNSWHADQDADSRSYDTYFWMSFYDKSLLDAGYAFDFEDADNYHHNYQYDGGMWSHAGGIGKSSSNFKLHTANVFTAKGYEHGERLVAVGVEFAKAQTPYTVSIYKNLTNPTDPESGTLMADSTVSGTCGCAGFYTLPLSEPVNLAFGDTFAVEVELGVTEEQDGFYYAWYSYEGSGNGSFFNCVTAAKEGQSFVKQPGSTWTDFGKDHNGNLRIKAYTMDDDGGTGLPTEIRLKDELKTGIEVGKGDTYQASCTVLPRSAADTSVRWESDQPSVATVNEKGLITGISDGTARITVTCNADATVNASFSVTVFSGLRSIQIKGASIVTAGKTLTLQTVCSPSSVDAADIQWKSSNERVLTVDGDGIVTGVAPGYATVTAGIGEVTASREITCEYPPFDWQYSFSGEGLILSWYGFQWATSYQIYRGGMGSTDSQQLLAAIPADGEQRYSYLDTSVEGGKQYCYEVRAVVPYIRGDSTEEKTVTTGVRWTSAMPIYSAITYHMNGGINSGSNPGYYREGYAYNYIYPPMSRVGYTFTGWYFDEKLTRELEGRYLPSDLTGPIDLYAGWSPIVYSIMYVTNGGINAPDNINSYTIEDDSFTLRAPTRTGYRFRGWYTDYSFTDPISVIEKGVTYGHLYLYARWEQLYKITYNLNGGVNAPKNPASYAESDVITLEEPTKKGYIFAGWYTDSAFTDSISEIRERSGNLTLHAKWTEAPKKITYVLNGGTSEDDLNPFTYVAADGSVRLKAPTRAGYDFQGWYRENTYENRVEYLNSGSVTEDLTLFAKWELHTYQITYVLYGGTNAAGNPGTYTVESAVILLQDAVKADSTFEGWYSDPKYQQKVTKLDPTDKCDITLYAKWQGEEAPDIASIRITPPTRTTYKQGDSMILTGGTLTCMTETSEYHLPMTADMISGFDASVPGICPVTVTYESFTETFDTLVIAEPQVEASAGQKLSEIQLPANGYGVYSWIDGDISFTREGSYTAAVSFVPNDGEKFQTLTDLSAVVTVSGRSGTSVDGARMILDKDSFCYTGSEQRPSLTIRLGNRLLTEGEDYTLSYEHNRNVGMATIVAEGIGEYYGSLSQSFLITPAALQIKAKDMKILIGSPMPQPGDFEYEMVGLLSDDRLITEPVLACNITLADLNQAGQFLIVPSAADAGSNYTIAYEAGLLRVVSEYLTYKVTFDVQGHGKMPAALYDVKAGSTIEAPANPNANGYVFMGWCTDATCVKDWDFETDIVQSDITLYARWLKESTQADSEFRLQEIEDIYYYTGNAWKPSVRVYDGDSLLKAGRDYTIKYFNNINANAGGVWKKGSGQDTDFNAALPYVQISGKGNYTDEVKVNFDIHPAVISNEEGNPAQKVVLRYTDQFVTAKRGVLKPFGSIKYMKGMKQDKDYRLTLSAINVRDDSGNNVSSGFPFEKAWIPAGYSGEFLLTIEGIGNYEGSIRKTVQVTDKDHLMKNAKITIGKNQKKVELIGTSVQLTPSTSDSADTFTVKMGKTVLRPGQDYEVSYLDHSNERVGKATLVITGIGDYTGTKTAAFTVIGKAFTARTITVSGLSDKVYTGKAITQNDAVLVYNTGKSDERQLKYGTDYTVSYTKNINKGTATITFKGVAESGFSGSLKKSFKITADDISMVHREKGWDKIVVSYSKAGAKPAEQLIFTNASGVRLRNGKDYTLSYTNNKLAADSAAEKAPTIIVKGKGNYQGTFTIPFTIAKADLRSKLDNGEITVKTTAVAYQPKKSDNYSYKPAVKVLEGKTALRLGTDVIVTYRNNTQADYKAYIQSLDGNIDAPAPEAIITVPSESNYMLEAGADESHIVVPLTIYQNKLTKKNLKVTFLTESIYTGTQVRPKVAVSYLNAEGGQILLTEGKDYTISYGANVKSGNNAGSVTISGIGTYYGGDVTVKFAIQRKKIRY